MRIMVFSFFILFSCLSSAGPVNLMGCQWQVPDRFMKQGDYLWVSSAEGSVDHFFFKNEVFEEEYIKFSIAPSELRQKIYFTHANTKYELLVYVLYSLDNESILLPDWIVIKNQDGPGVIYLNGLTLDEIIHFAGLCVPDLQASISKP